MVLTAQNSVSIVQQNSELKDQVEIVSKDTTYNVMFAEFCLIYFVYVKNKVCVIVHVLLIMKLLVQSKYCTSYIVPLMQKERV